MYQIANAAIRPIAALDVLYLALLVASLSCLNIPLQKQRWDKVRVSSQEIFSGNDSIVAYIETIEVSYAFTWNKDHFRPEHQTLSP